jgi:hypothetical protein
MEMETRKILAPALLAALAASTRADAQAAAPMPPKDGGLRR